MPVVSDWAERERPDFSRDHQFPEPALSWRDSGGGNGWRGDDHRFHDTFRRDRKLLGRLRFLDLGEGLGSSVSPRNRRPSNPRREFRHHAAS